MLRTICIHIYVYTYICICICMYVCMYVVFMCVSICVHMCVYNLMCCEDAKWRVWRPFHLLAHSFNRYRSWPGVNWCFFFVWASTLFSVMFENFVFGCILVTTKAPAMATKTRITHNAPNTLNTTLPSQTRNVSKRGVGAPPTSKQQLAYSLRIRLCFVSSPSFHKPFSLTFSPLVLFLHNVFDVLCFGGKQSALVQVGDGNGRVFFSK